uniref:Ferritin n=1 Tax=Acanthochromis polyacanthus TaxID=80966 RepID=A0A3Q1G348_9TELE
QTTACLSQVRQNFHQDCEAANRGQINLELDASYVYALLNFARFFSGQSYEEHAEKLMKLQSQRGRIFLQDVRKLTL